MRTMVNLLAGVQADTRLVLSKHTAEPHDSIEFWVSRIAWAGVAIALLWDISVTFTG
jgi:hypothetical protein